MYIELCTCRERAKDYNWMNRIQSCPCVAIALDFSIGMLLGPLEGGDRG